MNKKSIFIVLSTILCMNLHAQDIPNAALFLPAPPSTLEFKYINDVVQYEWGKSIRETSRGEQARNDMSWDFETYMNVFSGILGIELSRNVTPYIYQMFEYGFKHYSQAIEASQMYYYSQRPYAKFNEDTLVPDSENKYRSISSYPSEQATYGWLMAMLLTEICPAKQDQLLKRGYEFGESAVIAGYNWYSDAIVGRELASTLMIYFHTHGGFSDLIKVARSEYENKAGTRGTKAGGIDISVDILPNGVNYLPEPPNVLSVLYAYDISQYNEGKMIRNTKRGDQANSDCQDDLGYISKIFSPLFGMTISESGTPNIYKLLDTIRDLAGNSTEIAKDYYKRERPFAKLNDDAQNPNHQKAITGSYSYPSGHTSFGWLVGLALSEINPACQEKVMARAYEFGQSRVIGGYHWQTDVDAGRLAAGACFARLHAEQAYIDLLDKAVKEYKNGTSSIRSNTRIDEDDVSAPIYTIGGVRLDGEPTKSGIYIKGNKKIAY
jgi:membrane-associated phospholipid phosphatase